MLMRVRRKGLRWTRRRMMMMMMMGVMMKTLMLREDGRHHGHARRRGNGDGICTSPPGRLVVFTRQWQWQQRSARS